MVAFHGLQRLGSSRIASRLDHEKHKGCGLFVREPNGLRVFACSGERAGVESSRLNTCSVFVEDARRVTMAPDWKKFHTRFGVANREIVLQRRDAGFPLFRRTAVCNNVSPGSREPVTDCQSSDKRRALDQQIHRAQGVDDHQCGNGES